MANLSVVRECLPLADLVRPELGGHVVWPLEVLVRCLFTIELVCNLLFKDDIGKLPESWTAYGCIFGASQHLDVLLQTEPSILLSGFRALQAGQRVVRDESLHQHVRALYYLVTRFHRQMAVRVNARRVLARDILTRFRHLLLTSFIWLCAAIQLVLSVDRLLVFKRN